MRERGAGSVNLFSMATLVLTAIGDDHAGLVRALSGVIAEHNGNWETSRMAHLAGKFAGIVLVTVPDNHIDGLLADLRPLEDQGILEVAAELSSAVMRDQGQTRLTLEVVGVDRPGIVRDVSDVLARQQVNIEELETETVSAPMDGGEIFKARATLSLPDAISIDYLTEALEDLAGQLMVDIELDTD
jgi:glycine cleavage system regulatory protein